MEEKLKNRNPEKIYELTVKKGDSGTRLDRFLAGKIPEISRSMIKKLILNSMVIVNGVSRFPHYSVKEGETVRVTIPEPEKNIIEPVEMDLDIIYEDEDLLVINKPPGLPVHPAAGHKKDTLVNALLAYMGKNGKLSTIGGVERPGIVHRLDKDTSGVLIIAKNDRTHMSLSIQFQNRKVVKIYEAILKGILEENRGTINRAIVRHPVNRKRFTVSEYGRDSTTYYEVIDRKNNTTWVKFIPKTGRTHQLRVHSVSIGHPIIGDPIYSRGAGKFKNLALVAKSITITHPKAGQKITFIASYPEHFIEMAREFGYEIENSKNQYFWEDLQKT